MKDNELASVNETGTSQQYEDVIVLPRTHLTSNSIINTSGNPTFSGKNNISRQQTSELRNVEREGADDEDVTSTEVIEVKTGSCSITSSSKCNSFLRVGRVMAAFSIETKTRKAERAWLRLSGLDR